MNNEAKFQIARLTLGFDREEDRISLAAADAAGSERTLWLTRRLMLRLLGLMRSRIEESSTAAANTLPQWRDSVLAMEHAAIVARAAAFDNPNAVRLAAGGALVTRIDLQHTDTAFILHFMSDAQEPACLVLDRASLHRFAAALARQMQQAEWAGDAELGWLGPALQSDTALSPGPFTLN